MIYSDISSSLPGYMISWRITARTLETKTKRNMQMMPMDIAVATPLMPLLPSQSPNVIVASVKPVLGKTMAHQFRWKEEGGSRMTAMTAIQKNQRLKAQRKAAADIARRVIMRASWTAVSSWRRSSWSGRLEAMPTRARAVKAGGPTQMNIPGLCSRLGRPDCINRPM